MGNSEDTMERAVKVQIKTY